ncbi:YafY family transcriptional regulator [Paenibacillus sp. 1011MAR3C5]|uniref:helix-turn-helix transcriptional regulator n=1 Tax=Paenibacillus sp. 1011MAR3C5 TaxID=1675787 RepID=UPI000E6B7008|nr:YafY family protein [Paenibacillus sp. 1011MAR3C5]RJE86188.1 YafY family transcriptional regulator [Paenibacillus sp. 1011MAR3C5]
MQKSQRLIQMIMMINARRSFTVRELADEFGLSMRTITRDLQELSELGIPIYSVQGRGGGYRLLRERLLPPISFTEGEAVALFFACHSLQFLGSLPFGEGADSALHKFYHYLPADMREKIDTMKERIMIWSPKRPMSEAVLRMLLLSIMERKIVTIRYRSESGESVRDIQVIGLYASSGYWYCPAYCMQRKEIRQFRADRILSAEWNEDVPYVDEIAQLTLQDKPDKSSLAHVELRVSLTARGAWELEANPRFSPYMERFENGSGKAVIPIPQEDIPFYGDLLWSLGAEAVVEGPEEAIVYIRSKIQAMLPHYDK